MLSLAEHYHNLLETESNSVNTLVNFYKDLFEVSFVTGDDFAKMGRLIKIYGTELIYYSLLDCVEVKNVDTSSVPTRLISYFAKKRLQESLVVSRFEDLTGLVAKTQTELGKKRKIKIPELVFKEEE